MKIINFNLLTPMNVLAIGAIVFFWGSLAFFAANAFSNPHEVNEK